MAEQHTDPNPEAPTRPGPDRFLIGIVGGTILLILVSIAVVALLGRPRDQAPADPKSPAGVVQQYVEAIQAGDIPRSRTYLTRESRAQAEARDRQNSYRPSASDNVRIVVEQVSATETEAEVKVTISRFYARSDPFSSSSSHRDVTVRLLREDGDWRISQPNEPYSFSY